MSLSSIPRRIQTRRSAGRIDTSSPLPPNVEPLELPQLAKRAKHYEEQLGELHNKFSEHRSNTVALGSSLGGAVSELKTNLHNADQVRDMTVPHISHNVDKSTRLLAELEEMLPLRQSRLLVIHGLYDSGRLTAQQLLSDLEWLNLDWWERWRRIIFTSTSPVSWKWKAVMRFLFCIFFIAFTWLTYIAFGGAYRAHRHRLVWGEKLIS